MIVGIIGVGHLAASILSGLLRAGVEPASILLSPRGQAHALSARWGIPLAVDNDDLVTRADIVLLSVRPVDAPAAIADLPWRAGQTLVSFCAGVTISHLEAGPARVMRAMPLTAASINASPTVCFPAVEPAIGVLKKLGPVIPLGSEDEFEIATVNAAVYGWAQDLIRQSADWATAQGGDAVAMRKLAALTFVAAGRLIAETDRPMETLIGELVTPGGITELGLDVLASEGQPQAWQAACDTVLLRLSGRSKA
ncbi:NAD(P)-binding domain-containing protein (plasmid) [Shinella sp. H4-D48]|uniref:pyrroline-5-carboxylate reductase family protein n=1 Tax=Shinella sp. H4-D48 TaxID=2925841 RepID=UPI001F532331|nr:NAD(P)-binding domain-containing protein [Shinella sp. H4-D48]UNK40985.1 NAD(P)-binding domain-containing protein [Shinella sp. H4-D48]